MPTRYRVVHRLTVDEAEPLLAHGLVTASILDADLMGVEIVWAVDRLRRYDSKSPVIIYTSTSDSAWEEEAFLHGVDPCADQARPRPAVEHFAGTAGKRAGSPHDSRPISATAKFVFARG